MPIDAQGYWYPELAPKQLEIYNSKGRCILASGPKMSGKTWGNLHRLIRHAIETPKARIGMFAKTVKNAKSGGVWADILDIVLPEWLDAGVTKITTRKSDGTYGPKQDAQTRMMYIRLKNMYGSESEIQLHSIDNEREVEAIAKGTRFSMFYFAELSNFKSRLVFDITSDQLRMPGLEFWDHLWLADTNPSDDGPDSWIYKLWYEDRLDPDSKTPALQKQLALIEVMIRDNPYLSDEEREALMQRFSHDKDLYSRYIEGKWTRASKGSLFGDYYREETHRIGNVDSINEEEWEVLLPSDHCHTLLTGWDLGDKYHSAHIAEPIETVEGTVYMILDEVNHITDDNMGISEFVEKFMDRYEVWLKQCKREPSWRHWSDSAALTNYRAGAEGYDQNLVYRYSDGNVDLNGAPKFPGS
ncbi:MAG: phage terminase large subunit, partial [bacterium]